MTDKWPGDGRREVMQDLAEDAAADGKHFFYVRIPGDWKPVERTVPGPSQLDPTG
jgi:hypothetical protein